MSVGDEQGDEEGVKEGVKRTEKTQHAKGWSFRFFLFSSPLFFRTLAHLENAIELAQQHQSDSQCLIRRR